LKDLIFSSRALVVESLKKIFVKSEKYNKERKWFI